MIDLNKYNLNNDDYIFFEDLIYNLVESQFAITLIFDNSFSFQIDPCGCEFQVWHCGTMISKYKDLDDLLFNFKLDNKPFIEQLNKIEYE